MRPPRVFLSAGLVRLLLAGLGLVLPSVRLVWANPVAVEEIIARVSENAEEPSLAQQRDAFAYRRSSTVDHLDDDGSVKRQEVRIYRVQPEEGRPFTRLLTINGKPPTAKQEERRSKARETGDRSRMLAFNRDLLSRFSYVLLREETVGGRPAWVLAFSPKPGTGGDGFLDRLVGAMAGTLWIDQGDYQVAQAEIRLVKKVSFFGGIAGAIERMELTLRQRRLEPGVWLGEAVTIDFAGRKLFSGVRFRCREHCENFERSGAGSGASPLMSEAAVVNETRGRAD